MNFNVFVARLPKYSTINQSNIAYRAMLNPFQSGCHSQYSNDMRTTKSAMYDVVYTRRRSKSLQASTCAVMLYTTIKPIPEDGTAYFGFDTLKWTSLTLCLSSFRNFDHTALPIIHLLDL